MSHLASAVDLKAISISRRLSHWFGYYALGLWCLLGAWTGVVVIALIGILAIEMISLFWRYNPSPARSFADPAPAGWQTPIRALRWSLMLWNISRIGSGVLVITVVMVIIAVVARPSHLGTNNLVVLIVLGLWLATRPFWSPRLARAVQRPLQEIQTQDQPPSGARLSITSDGLDIAVPAQLPANATAQPSWIWHVGFSEIDELRVLSAEEAGSYGYSMALYDPTLPVRANVDLARYAHGQIQRPAIFLGGDGVGASLLVRGPDVLCLAGLTDGTGPAAVAAWQAWRAAHRVSPAT